MYNRLIHLVLFLPLLALFAGGAGAQSAGSQLFQLVNRSAFVEAEHFLADSAASLSRSEQHFYQAVLQNAFNQPAASNTLLKKIERTRKDFLQTPLQQKLYYATLYDNYIKQFDYAQACVTGRYMLEAFKAIYTPGQLEEEQQALHIWEALQQTPRQVIRKKGTTSLPLTRDMAGLIHVPATVNDSSYAFVFDTGAGMCTISESFAAKLRLQPVPGSPVAIKSGITGIPTQVKLALAPDIRLGNITIRNSVFLVFPDTALSFAGGRYRINAILGFPIAKDLGEMIFEGNRLTIFSKEAYSTKQKNLAVDQLKPLLFLDYEQQSLPFTFDTGAGISIFSDVFYQTFREKIDALGIPQSKQLGGTGGFKTFQGISIPQLTLVNAGQPITFRNVFISKEELNTTADRYYGNLGQDVVRQFKRMVLNFSRSYLLLEN